MLVISLIVVAVNLLFRSLFYWIGSLLFVVVVPLIKEKHEVVWKKYILAIMVALLLFPFQTMYINYFPVAYLSMFGFCIAFTFIVKELSGK